MSVLIFFVGVWAVFAIWGFRQKMGSVIALGGGFVVGCLSLVPVILGGKYLDQHYGPGVQAQQHDGRISQAVVLAGLGDFAPELEPAPPVNGRERALGKTGSGSTGLLEISGKALDHEVEKATLAFPAVLNDKAVTATNVQMAARYVQALFPEWVEPKVWLESNALTSAEDKTVEREGRRITVKLSQELNMWLLTVEKI